MPEGADVQTPPPPKKMFWHGHKPTNRWVQVKRWPAILEARKTVTLQKRTREWSAFSSHKNQIRSVHSASAIQSKGNTCINCELPNNSLQVRSNTKKRKTNKATKHKRTAQGSRSGVSPRTERPTPLGVAADTAASTRRSPC